MIEHDHKIELICNGDDGVFTDYSKFEFIYSLFLILPIFDFFYLMLYNGSSNRYKGHTIMIEFIYLDGSLFRFQYLQNGNCYGCGHCMRGITSHNYYLMIFTKLQINERHIGW